MMASGNGCHLYFRVDLPPELAELLSDELARLDIEFSDDRVAVDRTVYNPSRITKVAGTVARKGDE